jgi:iron-sulfur cluster assembly protein
MITITQSASDHIFDYLKQRGKGVGIRVGVKTTGCSGFAYVVEPVDEKQEWDNVFKDKGIDIYVDSKSLIYIDGSEMDYVTKGLNTGIEFKNPNIKAECGCGESFTV